MHNSDIVEILLIEDNDVDAELTIRALHKNHLSNHIHRLVDGQEALDYLFQPETASESEKHAPPRLILLDLKLPKINGLEVLKAIKNDPLTKKIPVVVLTSSSQEQDIVESYQLGVNSYIVKPVEFDRFVEAVQKLGFYWLLLNQSSS